MKNIIAAALVGAFGLVAAAYPAKADAIKLTDGQLDSVTAGGSVVVTASGSVIDGIVYQKVAAGATPGEASGVGVTVSFGTNPQSSTTVGGSGIVYSKVISGGSGALSFSVSVGVAK